MIPQQSPRVTGGAVVADISDKAQDLSELLNGDGITETIAVKGTGKIKEYNTDTPETLSDSRTGWIYRNYRGSGPDRWTELQYRHP